MSETPIHDSTADRTDSDVPGAEAAPDETPREPENTEAADTSEPEREEDGTVGDFDGDIAAFNNRPATETDDKGNTEAEFRGATGHNDDEPDE